MLSPTLALIIHRGLEFIIASQRPFIPRSGWLCRVCLSEVHTSDEAGTIFLMGNMLTVRSKWLKGITPKHWGSDGSISHFVSLYNYKLFSVSIRTYDRKSIYDSTKAHRNLPVRCLLSILDQQFGSFIIVEVLLDGRFGNQRNGTKF